MFEIFFSNLLFQIINFIVIIYFCGYFISILNKLFYKLVKNKIVMYATGIVGTTIHELSHAVMCKIFFHKIVDMKLYQIDEENHTLGYVKHTYNPKNIYQLLGCYFIGIAPIICGSTIIWFASKFFLPNTFTELNEYINTWSIIQSNGISVNLFIYFFDTIIGIFTSIISEISFTNLSIIFVIITLCIALHMNLSREDIKNSLKSIPLLIGIIILVNLIMFFIFKNLYNEFIKIIYISGSFIICLMVIAIIFSIIYVIIGLSVKGTATLVKFIPKIFNKIKIKK